MCRQGCFCVELSAFTAWKRRSRVYKTVGNKHCHLTAQYVGLSMTLFTKICARVSIHRCFTRSNSTCNVPKKWWWRYEPYNTHFLKERILTQLFGCCRNVGRGKFLNHCSSSREECVLKNATYQKKKKTFQNEMLIARTLIFCCFYVELAQLGHSRRIRHRHGLRMYGKPNGWADKRD